MSWVDLKPVTPIMDDCNDSDDYVARRLLSTFAARLHEICQAEPVKFYPSLPGSGFRVNAAELAEGGLNLILEGHGCRYIAMEDIRNNSFHRKYGDVSCWVTPEWM